MGGKGSTKITPPDPVDPGQSMGEYLFGKGFSSFQGVTDPELQQRLIEAERTYRPQYAALELADIGTFARGIEGDRANPEYQRIQSEIAALEAGGEATGRLPSKEELEATANKLYPVYTGGRTRYPVDARTNEKNRKLRKEYIESGGPKGRKDRARAEEIASLKSRLSNTSPTLDRTPGLFDLLGESSERAFELQQSQLGQQREADVAALQRFAPQVVQAYRDADPESTRLAEMASARAGQETGLGARGQELLGSQVQAASEAERQLQQMGMTLGDLSPTEQEALISGRGTEFIQSTGELSPLEQRRAQQSSRQASLARGREMGQGSLYDEMLARQSEELNKQERQVALGSQLLGQQAGMRGARLGQGAGMLTASEAMAAQRRAEQLQRMQLGSGFIGQEEGIQSGRFNQAFNMNRALAGDAGNIILGRPSSAIQLGQQQLGQAQQGAEGQMGPQLFDANVGYNAALQRSANEFGLLGAQAQADATRSSGFMQGLGTVAGAALCWVAREVYGIENPKWIQFRNWMLNDSPSWFRNLYIKYGERFAKFISNKPALKNIIRKWMNTKIK